MRSVKTMTDRANGERGEISLSLEGVDYVLRPSFEASATIEKLTGKSLFQLATAAVNHALTIHDGAIVAAEYIRAYGLEKQDNGLIGVNSKRVGEMIFAAGMLHVVSRLAAVLTNAVNGGVQAEDDIGDDAGEPMAAGMEQVPAAD